MITPGIWDGIEDHRGRTARRTLEDTKRVGNWQLLVESNRIANRNETKESGHNGKQSPGKVKVAFCHVFRPEPQQLDSCDR